MEQIKVVSLLIAQGTELRIQVGLMQRDTCPGPSGFLDNPMTCGFQDGITSQKRRAKGNSESKLC